jgi:hypothetical protein
MDVALLMRELGMVVLPVGTPEDVNGALETEDAPLKAGTVLLGFGAADVLLGFKTLL